MLGRTITDPHGIEGPPGQIEGLAFLEHHTELTPTKSLRAVTGHTLPDKTPITGYEMHLGVTTGPDRARPFARLDDGTFDGARSPDGLIAGTYLHGLFAHDRQRAVWLGPAATPRNHDETTEAILDAFAAHLETHIDIDALLAISTR